MSKSETPDFLRNKAFEELQRLLRERENLSPEEAARSQYDFEKKLRERMKDVERSIHQKDLERTLREDRSTRLRGLAWDRGRSAGG